MPDLFSLLVQIGLPVFLFVPGYFVLKLFESKRRMDVLSFWDRLVAGCILWFFLFISISTVIGLLSNYLPFMFNAFLIVSSLIIEVGLAYSLKNRAHFPRLRLPSPILVLIFLVLGVLFLFSYFQSSFYEYDASKFYLPFSASILKSGGLIYDVYRSTGFTTTMEPAGPLIFAWLLQFGSFTSITVTGFLLTALTSLCVYKVAREVAERQVAVISGIVFLMFPSTAIMVFHYIAYLDVAFVFFTSALLLCIMRWARTGARLWIWLALMSVSSALLTREFAIFLVPMLVAPILAQAPSRISKVISLPLFGSVFTGLSLFDLLQSPSSEMIAVLLRWTPVLLFTLIFAIITSARTVVPGLRVQWWRGFWAGILLLLAPLAFLVRNMVFYRAITFEFSPFGIFRTSPGFAQAASIVVQGFYKQAPNNILGYLRYDQLFATTSTAGVFIFPLIIGITAATAQGLRTRNFSLLYVLLSFLSGLLLYSYFFPQDVDIRRFYLLCAVSASVLTALGLFKIISLLGLDREHAMEVAAISIASTWFFLAFIGFWPSKLTTLIFINSTAPLGEQLAWLGSLIVPLFLMGASYTVILTRNRFRMLSSSRVKQVFPQIVISLILIFTVLSAIEPLLLDVVRNGDNILTYTAPGWENGMREVTSYYSTHIFDPYATVGFYINELIYYQNRVVIDLSALPGIVAFLPVLNAQSPTDVIQNLIDLNVRYFLLPLSGNSRFSQYSDFRDRYLVFTMIDSSSLFVTIEVFQHFRLIRFIPPNESATSLLYQDDFRGGWSTTNSHSNLILSSNGASIVSSQYERVLADDNQTKFWIAEKGANSGTFNISDDTSNFMSGSNSLRIRLNLSAPVDLAHWFPIPVDFSNYAGLEFYWFGAGTQSPIPISLHTNPWKDYLVYSFKDDFLGWKKIIIPFSTMHSIGNPSTAKISLIQFQLASVPYHTALTFWLDFFALPGGRYGIKSAINSTYGGYSPLTVELKIRPLISASDFLPFLSLGNSSATFWNARLISDGSGFAYYSAIPKDILSASTVITVFFVTVDVGLLLYLNNIEIFADY